MIERLEEGRLVVNPPNPLLGVQERAMLECGCHVWVGKRLDTMEAATLICPCSPTHEQLMNHFAMLLRLTTAAPEEYVNQEMVVVCDELLGQAERYSGT